MNPKNDKPPFFSRVIRWDALSPILSGLIAGFGSMALGDLAAIIAIRTGDGQLYSGLKAIFIIGFLTGITVFYFTLHRPMTRFNRRHEAELWDTLNDCMAIIRMLQKQLREKRIEGDEWKDGPG